MYVGILIRIHLGNVHVQTRSTFNVEGFKVTHTRKLGGPGVVVRNLGATIRDAAICIWLSGADMFVVDIGSGAELVGCTALPPDLV